MILSLLISAVFVFPLTTQCSLSAPAWFTPLACLMVSLLSSVVPPVFFIKVTSVLASLEGSLMGC